jgi:hypothetical protein
MRARAAPRVTRYIAELKAFAADLDLKSTPVDPMIQS